MKKSHFIYTRIAIFMAAILLGVLLSGCGPSPEDQTATDVALAAAVATSTPTVTPTLTPTPTSTPEPTSVYIPAPRWMLLGQPGPNVEILDERWEYYGDVWREFSACIQYQQNDYTRHFEECFAVINEDDPTFTFDQVLSPFLENDYVKLIPQSTFGEVGQISLVGQKKDDGTARFLELIGTQKYIYLVEMGVSVLEDAPLQAIYEDLAADVMDYLLKDILQKSRVVLPTPTPLSNNQQKVYDSLGGLLVTEQEAGEGWEAIGDSVSETYVQLRRSFELRVNADVLWVAFTNSIYDRPAGFEIGDIADFYTPDDVLLESSHSYAGDFVIYGWFTGHTYYDAWLFQDGLLYQVSLESRTPMGATIENLFTQSVDDFLHNILMINSEPSYTPTTPTQIQTPTLTTTPTITPTKAPTSTKIVDLLPSNACGPGESLLYIEDFQDGSAEGWPIIEGQEIPWSIIPDPYTAGNIVVKSAMSVMDPVSQDYLEGYIFENAVWRAQFMSIGNPVFNFGWHWGGGYKVDGTTVDWSRYSIWFDPPYIRVFREQPPISIDTLRNIRQTMESEVWHQVEIATFEGVLDIWIDGTLFLSYQDPNPIPAGQAVIGTGYGEVLGTAPAVYFDDLVICELTKPFDPLPTSEP